MPVLTPLVPTPHVHVDGYDFLALAACRTDQGLLISMTASNGNVCWADTLYAEQRSIRIEAAAVLAQSSKLTPIRADYAILQLIPKTEDKYRSTVGNEPSPSTEEWPDPIPLSGSAPPPFPVACFPDWLRAMVTSTAEQLQVPVDLPAMLALSILGTALAGKVEVMIRAKYYVPLNCYVIVGMESGERKSPTYRSMLKPAVEHERERIAAVREENLARESRKEEPLPLPQVFADDITTEQVPVLLEQNAERLAIFSDEGDALDIMAGRYSKGTPNFGIYLRGWDGGAYKVNRGMRPPIYLHHPLLTLGLCVQPSVLQGLAETEAFRDRGLLGRIWFALPVSFMGWRKSFGMPATDAVVDAYARHITELFRLPTLDRAAAIPLTHEAHSVLTKFSSEMEPSLRPDGDLRPIKDWVAKLEGSIGRIAGQLHMAYGFGIHKHISTGTLEKAITIGRYLLAQSQCTFGLMRSNPLMLKAEILLRWIERRGLAEFSRRDCYKANPTHFETPEDCIPALSILIERYYIVQRPPPKKTAGRPPTTVYDVNPKILGQNGQNPNPPEETGGSEACTEQGHNSESIDNMDDITPPPLDPGDEWLAGGPGGY